MTSRARARYLWLPALLLLWVFLGWQRWTAPPPYSGPIHTIESARNVG